MLVILNNIINESSIYRNVLKNEKYKYLNIFFVCLKYMC